MKAYLKVLLAGAAAPAAAGLCALPAMAGGDAPIEEAPVYSQAIHQISIFEAEKLHERPEVTFYDVNTLEIWADGYIPGAIFFNVGNWKKLLPADKNAPLVFYCANRLCSSSEIAAYEVMKLGYTNVMQMPDGIYGWKLSGHKFERP